jgi:hypothetical protein
MIGVLYQFGFWIPFHFNILDFLSPIDIIKSSIYPIIPAILGSLFGVMIDTYNSQGLPERNDSDPIFIKLIHNILLLLSLILALIFAGNFLYEAYHLFTTEPEKRIYYAVPVVTLICLVYFIQKPLIFKEKNKYIRNFTMIFMSVLPSVSFFQGDRNAKDIINDNSSYYYLTNISNTCNSAQNSKNIYLGYFSENFIFLNNKSLNICLQKSENINLAYFKKK